MIFDILTKAKALADSEEIVKLHNLIPFQKWEISDLLLERDKDRTYRFKWDVSSVCVDGNKVVGFCIAFKDDDTTICGIRNFLYLHRIAVDPMRRFSGIGRRLIETTCVKFFEVVRDKDCTTVLVKTSIRSNNNLSFENVAGFYSNLGFVQIGEKSYENRVDAIMVCPLERFIH